MRELMLTSDCENCPHHRAPIGNLKNLKSAEIMVLFYKPESNDYLEGSYEKWFLAQLKESGINVNPLFIAYAVPCTGDDSAIAAKHCSEGLRDLLKVFESNKGKVVLGVGSDVCRLLGFKDTLLNMRGSVCFSELYPDMPIVLTFDAGYLIKGNTSELITAYADFDKVLKIANAGYQKPIEDFYAGDDIDYIEKQIAEIVKRGLQEEVIIGVDLETTSLDPRRAKIITCGIAIDGNRAFSIPFARKGLFDYDFSYYKRAKQALQYLFDMTVQLFHNANFDVSVLISLGFDLKNVPHDTMLMHHCLHPELPHDLGYVTSIYGMTPYWKGAVLNNKSSMLKIDDDVLRTYNLRDCVVMMQIFRGLKEELVKDDLWNVYENIARKLIRPTVLMKLNGMRLLPSRLIEWKKEVAEALAQAKVAFLELSQSPESFNPNSAYHVGWLLFGKKPSNYIKNMEVLATYETVGSKKKKNTKAYEKLIEDTTYVESVSPLNLPKGSALRTKAGNLDTSKKNLTRIIMLVKKRLEELSGLVRRKPEHDKEEEALSKSLKVIQAFLQYKEWAKLQSTYTDFSLGSDGRIHPSYKIHGTRTGRLASAGPNWQNLPKKVKMLFGPQEGHVIVAADYSNIEMRVLAYESNDDVLQETFDQGRAVHDENVEVMFGIDSSHAMFPVAKRAAKTYIFGRGYGGGLKGIYERIVVQVPELNLSFEDFVKLDNTYREAHPAYVKWVDKMQKQADNRVCSNAFGRKRYFLDPIDMVKREILNTPIQSTAADIFNTSLIELQNYADANKGLGIKLIGAVHDSIVLEAPVAYAVKVHDKLIEIMERPLKLWNKLVSFPVEAEICPVSWAEPISYKDFIDGNYISKSKGHKPSVSRNFRDEEWEFETAEDV